MLRRRRGEIIVPILGQLHFAFHTIDGVYDSSTENIRSVHGSLLSEDYLNFFRVLMFRKNKMFSRLTFRAITPDDHRFWCKIEADVGTSIPPYVKNVLL